MHKDSERLFKMSFYASELIHDALPSDVKLPNFSAFAAANYHYFNVPQTLDISFFLEVPAQFRVSEIQKIVDTYTVNGHVIFNVTNLLCFLMKHDLLNDALILTTIDSIAILPQTSDFPLFSALRIIFSKDSLKKYRSVALAKLMRPHKYGFYLLSSAPKFAANIAFFVDFIGDPYFSKWLKSQPRNHAQSIKNVVEYEKASVSNVTPSFLIQNGFEGVILAYRQAIVDLYTFEMSLSTKFNLFQNIFINFKALNNEFVPSGMIFDEYTSYCPDVFVQVAVRLLSLIINDKTSYHPALSLSATQSDILFRMINRYVRSYEIQTELYRYLFQSVMESEVQSHILTFVPQFLNMNRFVLDIHNFKSLFEYSLTAEAFTAFVAEFIEHAFDKPATCNEAIDLDMSQDKSKFVSPRFFELMYDLYTLLLLPDRFLILTMQKVIEYAHYIDIRDEKFLAFLAALITPRAPSSTHGSYNMVKRKFGPEIDSIGPVNPEVLKLVIKFVLARNDIITCATEQEPMSLSRTFAQRLLKVARKEVERSPILKLILSGLTAVDINNTNIGVSSGSWSDSTCLHFAAFSARYSRLEVAISYFTRLPRILSIERAVHLENGDSWFNSISRLCDLILKSNNSAFANLLNHEVVEKVTSIFNGNHFLIILALVN